MWYVCAKRTKQWCGAPPRSPPPSPPPICFLTVFLFFFLGGGGYFVMYVSLDRVEILETQRRLKQATSQKDYFSQVFEALKECGPEGPECSVCMSQSPFLAFPPCGHYTCAACMNRWLSTVRARLATCCAQDLKTPYTQAFCFRTSVYIGVCMVELWCRDCIGLVRCTRNSN